MKKLSVLVVLTGLASCSAVSLPASGVTSDGQKWGGYFTTQEFTISNDKTTCKGKTPMGTAKQQSATFACDDGRTGTASTNRTRMTGGTVAVTFSDGLTGNFDYGTGK